MQQNQTAKNIPINDIDNNPKYIEKSKHRVELLKTVRWTVPQEYKKLNLPANPYSAFMNYQKAQGVSIRTYDYYEERLTKSLPAIGNPYTANKDIIIEYLNTITGNQYGYATRHASFRTLRTFYKYLEDNYGLPYPMKGVPVPTIYEDSVMPTLRLKELKQIMNLTDTRGKMIMALLTASAIRREELANLKVEDFDFNNSLITLKVKGGKIAYAPITFSEEYVKQYLKESGLKKGRLLGTSEKWENLNYEGIDSLLERLEVKAQKELNNPKLRLNAHVFRRAFAVIGKELGLADSVIQQGGRWKSEKMVKRYTKAFDFDDANRLMKKATAGILGA